MTIAAPDERTLERFLVWEATLLDEWRLDEWLGLFEPGGRYLIPSLDTPAGQPEDTLFLIDDDWTRLQSRVKQLLGRGAWAENPRSRTCRLVSNFRIADTSDETIVAHANFAVWRTQSEKTHVFVGHYRHLLVRGANGLLFRERKAVLAMDALRPHGRVSFII